MTVTSGQDPTTLFSMDHVIAPSAPLVSFWLPSPLGDHVPGSTRPRHSVTGGRVVPSGDCALGFVWLRHGPGHRQGLHRGPGIRHQIAAPLCPRHDVDPIVSADQSTTADELDGPPSLAGRRHDVSRETGCHAKLVRRLAKCVRPVLVRKPQSSLKAWARQEGRRQQAEPESSFRRRPLGIRVGEASTIWPIPGSPQLRRLGRA